MATSEICSLVLKLTVYPKDIFVDVKEFVLKADSLLKLDLYTFQYVAKRLATGSVKNTEYEYVFNDILLKERCPQVLRFLLNDFNKLEMDSIYDIFLSSVDDFDNPRFLHERAPEENPKGYYYRYPYRND